MSDGASTPARIIETERLGFKTRPRILVTGFGPFPAMPFNASQALVEDLEERKAASPWGEYLHTAILPTDWRRAPRQAGVLIDGLKPDVILHIGVSSRTDRFQIETRAFNATRNAADCSEGYPLGHYVRRGGPPVLKTTLPAELIVSRLRLAKVPASLSSDAGRYLCNAILYESLFKAGRSPHLRFAGFIHIPALSPHDFGRRERSGPACGWGTLKTGLDVIIDTMILFARKLASRSMRKAVNRVSSGSVWGERLTRETWPS